MCDSFSSNSPCVNAFIIDGSICLLVSTRASTLSDTRRSNGMSSASAIFLSCGSLGLRSPPFVLTYMDIRDAKPIAQFLLGKACLFSVFPDTLADCHITPLQTCVFLIIPRLCQKKKYILIYFSKIFFILVFTF